MATPTENTTLPETLVQTWADLVPDHSNVTFDDPYAALSPEQMQHLRELNRTLWLLANGKEDPAGPAARRADELRGALAGDGLDADWLLSQREAIRNQRKEQLFDPRIEGRSVRLLGRAMPLEFGSHRRSSPFLLTPSLPSCSHADAPPAHLVTRVDPAGAVDLGSSDGSDHPFWVEGTVRFDMSSYSVFRVCGMMQLGASYRLEPTRVDRATGTD